MNKVISKKLNTYEVVAVLYGILCIYALSLIQSVYYKELLVYVAIISEVLIVSIELFLFYLANLKNKFYTVGYYLIELFIIIYMNIKVPFIGLLFLLLFSLLKGFYRITNFDSIYVTNRLYNVCKKYGIKIKRDYKKKETVITDSSPKRKTQTGKANSKAGVSESYA